ncbi:DEAD/DEAH box helicase family protein [Helicobacter sp. 23-1048]
MNSQNLSTELQSALKYAQNIEIPAYITGNLSKTLRQYQIQALKHYLLQRQNPRTNHLMFNMATGSGKTLIMAALMLECYKQGFRNFVFFVNSTNILEKTKSNFCDERSEKYLFAREIVIENQKVEINAVESLGECKENAINVYFNTIQGLYNLFTQERENALTLQDLRHQKIVLLADEAHHLNANTKSDENERGWENIVQKAFSANAENLLLEFSATIPKFESVLEKYSDKIVYEYALKQFHNDGFSKKIYLLKYNGLEISERFLGSVILNIYRMLLAKQNGIFLKPVILYKSKTINESLANEKAFLEFIANLDSTQVAEFIENYANLSKNEDDEIVLFRQVREFFEAQKITSQNLCFMIKELFSPAHIINANNDKDIENQQMLLNSLESKNNEIRVIFAVDKLNEGWDVLNLFDIVRLNKGAIKETTKEAQLIGRGARYYPFVLQSQVTQSGAISDYEFRRKFDNERVPLKALEILAYHAASENEFISRLNSELVNMGLRQSKQKNIVLRVKKDIMQSEFYKQAYFATNSRYKVSSKNSLFSGEIVRKIVAKSDFLEVPLCNAKGVQEENLMKENLTGENISNDDFSLDFGEAYKEIQFSDLSQRVILKAMNILDYNFAFLARNFEIESKREFIAKYLNLTLKLHPRQILDNPRTELQIALFVLEKFGEGVNKYLDSYRVGEWSVKPLKIIGDKEITRSLDAEVENFSKYEWFYFDKFSGTSLERAFLDFIESKKELINAHFKEWLIVRNERFSELAIYDDRELLENGEENANYAERFEPDFYFLGKRAGDNRVIMQCIIEPKGEHLVLNDKWKEEFLATLIDKKPIDYKDISVKMHGMPFFVAKNAEFREKFEVFIHNT